MQFNSYEKITFISFLIKVLNICLPVLKCLTLDHCSVYFKKTKYVESNPRPLMTEESNKMQHFKYF